MTVENGFAGQESDVNRACSAFGLDTVNYRAFPDTGPVLAPPPSVASPVYEQPSQPPFQTTATVPDSSGAPHLLNIPSQQPPPYSMHTAAAPDAGSFGMGFPLLAQALPAAATNLPVPKAAFSKARTPLRSIASNQSDLPQNQAMNPAVFGAAFAAAFNAAFSTQAPLTAPATAPNLSSLFQQSQS